MLLRFELDPVYFFPTIKDALAVVEPGFNVTSSSGTLSRSTLTYDSVNIVDEDTKI